MVVSPQKIFCRLMLARDAVFEFVQSHSCISPNAGGSGRNPLFCAPVGPERPANVLSE
jgi:hypothetical protein